LLAPLGYPLLHAYGGVEGLATARDRRPALVILDLMMPEMNGFEVVEALNEHPDTARIPIVVVTAKEITAEDRARLHGYVTRIMEKNGFDAARFMAEVRRALAGRPLVA